MALVLPDKLGQLKSPLVWGSNGVCVMELTELKIKKAKAGAKPRKLSYGDYLILVV